MRFGKMILAATLLALPVGAMAQGVPAPVGEAARPLQYGYAPSYHGGVLTYNRVDGDRHRDAWRGDQRREWDRHDRYSRRDDWRGRAEAYDHHYRGRPYEYGWR